MHIFNVERRKIMNNYYDNPVFPNIGDETFKGPIINDAIRDFGQNRNMVMNEEYVDTILNKNRGKKTKIYVTVPGSSEWQDKVYEGIIEGAGKDHLIISNPNNGEWNIIPLMYLVAISVLEPISYN